MGGAVSLQQRCRKALVIRAYNNRPADQTLEEQFSSYSYLKGDGSIYTNADLIKQCLNIGSNDYPWLDPLMQILSGSPAETETLPVAKPKVFEIRLEDFLNFLETGSLQIQATSEGMNKPPPGVRKRTGGPETPPRRNPSTGDISTTSAGSASPGSGKLKQFPPVAPISLDVGGRQSSRSKLVEVIEIDLSNGKALPEGVKLKSENQESVDSEGKQAEETLEIIVRSAPNSRLASNMPGGAKVIEGNGKQLWRKRETTRQERTVHYTTVDEEGETQELVEKETTQTEILHMECRDTGEFAHKETTRYEQVETFNDELVNEVHGHEEYVHLKSLEDEFHYMDSNMPPKGDPEKERQEAEAKERERQQQEHGEGKYEGGDHPHRYSGEGEDPHPHYPEHDEGGLSPRRKGAANASYIFEPADGKDRVVDPSAGWTAEEEEAYRQYCADCKQGDFQFAMPAKDVAEASVPIVSHLDEDNKEQDPNTELLEREANAPPTQDSCDTDAYAVGASAEGTIQEDESPAKPVYTSMHDID